MGLGQLSTPDMVGRTRSRSRSRSFSRRRRSSVRYSKASARAGTDVAVFRVVKTVGNSSTNTLNLVFSANNLYKSSVINIPVMHAVLTSDMGTALRDIYDEIKLVDASIKVTYNGSTLNK